MHYQRDTFSCGAAAVVNALRCLGRKVSERTVRKYSDTTEKDGTSQDGILNAVRNLGFTGTIYETEDALSAWCWFSESVRTCHPVILCVQNDEHWITAIGMIGDKVVTFDPGKFLHNLEEKGVLVLSKRDFMRKWKNSRAGKFFGISIGKK